MDIADLEKFELSLKDGPIPTHVGIIMDGNGRWAEARGLPRLAGHREGSNSVREVTRAARRLGIKALTLYAFSSENWSRPPEEVAGLMDLLREYLERERAEILDNGIRLHAIGNLERLPALVRKPLDQLRKASAANREMILTLALSYGGREEILQAAADFAQKASPGVVPSPTEFEGLLWTRGLPPVDLIIRTSGEYRISNFLLWQVAYAELVFVETPWPEFRRRSFLECIRSYQQRERRFGLTPSQVRQA
jgi:undecaprenyl diphosphate synthase